MSHMLSRQDIRFLKVMYKVGNILGITPFYDFEKSTIVHPFLNKIYALFLSSLEIIGLTWSIYIRNWGNSNDMQFFPLTFTILGSCDDLIMAMLIISLTLGLTCTNQKTWILICNIALAFKVRYRHLNKLLTKITNSERKNSAYIFEEVGKLSRLLGEMVGLFNNIFGFPLIFITGRCIVQMLASLNFFTSTLDIDDHLLRGRLLVSSMGQTALVLVTLSMLIMICDSVKSESSYTVHLCYKLREKFPEKSEQRKELLDLAHIVEKNRAHFTAAGFFEINKKTLFEILSTTTTYLIVTIQFNQSFDN
ncbi:gustatory receptor 28b, partial [Asbolus verrucosus]